MNDLKCIKDFTNVIEFCVDGRKYKKDSRACKSLNKTLETDYSILYRGENFYNKEWKYGMIDWSGETFYVITKKGKLLKFNNSEWGFVSHE